MEIKEDKQKKEIVITLPEAKILSHEIDTESIETLDEKDGLFNRITVEDIRQFDDSAKKYMEARVIENGLLEKAQASAQEVIHKIVGAGIPKESGYTIRFETD